MPDPLTTYVANWKLDYLELQVEFNNLYNDTYNLVSQLTAEGCPLSGITVSNMAVHILNIRNILGTGSGTLYYNMRKCMEWINNNWPTGGVVDMDAILNAMLVSSFDQLQKFIGIVDAYRVALWNAPFNADFYAALARGFQKWP